MMHTRLIWIALAIISCSWSEPAWSKKKIGDSGPIDRSSVQGGTYCPSPFNGSGNPAATYNYLASFVADGPTMSVVFRGRLRRLADNVFNDAAIDNVSVVSKAVYDTYKQNLISCGGDVHETLRFDLVPPVDLLYFNDFETSVGPEWSFDLYSYFASANQLGSAPISLGSNPPPGGTGSLGFGKVTDPGPYGIATLEVSGLTPGVEYVISYWWRNNTTLPAAVGDFWVEIYGSEQWSQGGEASTELQDYSGFGVAWSDFDNDGFDDLFVTNGGQNFKFANGGAGLTDVTSNTFGNGQSRGVAVADFDNDGNLDLVVGDEGGDGQIYEGGPGFLFTDIARPPFVGSVGMDNVTWVDLENDGELELFVTRMGAGCMLFDHVGGGEFLDVTTPLLSSLIDARGVAWGDYDDDGDQDAFVARYGQPNVLLRNDAGTLVDATPPSMGNSCLCSAAAWGDADNDLDLDLFVSNVGGDNLYYRNDGGTFSYVGVGLEDGREGVGANWADIDNDRDLDMYVVNEFVDDVLLMNLAAASSPKWTTTSRASGAETAPWRGPTTTATETSMPTSRRVGREQQGVREPPCRSSCGQLAAGAADWQRLEQGRPGREGDRDHRRRGTSTPRRIGGRGLPFPKFVQPALRPGRVADRQQARGVLAQWDRPGVLRDRGESEVDPGRVDPVDGGAGGDSPAAADRRRVPQSLQPAHQRAVPTGRALACRGDDLRRRRPKGTVVRPARPARR